MKTDPDLLNRLHAAVKRGITKEEMRDQRVSFVFGNLPQESTITRRQVENAIARIEGENAAA